MSAEHELEAPAVDKVENGAAPELSSEPIANGGEPKPEEPPVSQDSDLKLDDLSKPENGAVQNGATEGDKDKPAKSAVKTAAGKLNGAAGGVKKVLSSQSFAALENSTHCVRS